MPFFMKVVGFFLLIVLFLQPLCAQKTVFKSIRDKSISAINIDASNCYAIEVNTTEEDEIVVDAALDGEYSNDLAVKMLHKGNTYTIRSGFQPLFTDPNDKLSAHKVVSIFLKISLPRNLKVFVYGTSCDVSASGFYRELDVSLSDGDCILNGVRENVVVKTQSGDVYLNTSEGQINAESKYGKVVSNKQIPKSHIQYKISSVTGNIHLNKTE